MTIEDVIKKSILPLAFMVFWFWMTKTIMKVSGQTDWLATAHLPIKIHKPPAFCRRLDYISERYCAGLKTKSLKIQT